MSLRIEGEYWDSQIYSGELLLLDCNGAAHRLDWREIIDGLADKNSSIQTAIRVAFSDSDLFYNPKVRKILFDPHIEAPIRSQLTSLADLQLASSRPEWQNYWRVEDSPFDFLPTDTDIYYNNLFAGGDSGLFSAPRSSLGGGRIFGKRVSKHLDARVFQIRASDRFTAVAAAAGDDGLFEFAFSKRESEVLHEQRQLAKRPCSSCDWAFQSVMGWTVENAFLASFRQDRDLQSKRIVRSFDRIVESNEMFDEPNGIFPSKRGFTWGSREKVYRITDQGVEVVTYQHAHLGMGTKSAKQKASKLFSKQGADRLNFDATTAISTGTAPFGTVLEFDDRLVVLRSDGNIEQFPGEPVHWRVFPRSEHYSNQLHIIYDDHVMIVSFVHDYFVDQSAKLYGFMRGSGELGSE